MKNRAGSCALSLREPKMDKMEGKVRPGGGRNPMTNQLMAVVQVCNQQNFGSQWPQHTVVNGKKEN